MLVLIALPVLFLLLVFFAVFVLRLIVSRLLVCNTRVLMDLTILKVPFCRQIALFDDSVKNHVKRQAKWDTPCWSDPDAAHLVFSESMYGMEDLNLA